MITEYPPRVTEVSNTEGKSSELLVMDRNLENVLKTQINLLGKIERHLAIVTEEDIGDDEILIKE